MIKLTSLLNEQSIPGLNASLTIPEIAFPSGDYHIPPGDVPALKAAAKGDPAAVRRRVAGDPQAGVPLALRAPRVARASVSLAAPRTF